MSSRRTFIQNALGAATGLGGTSRLLGMNRKRASDRPNDSTPLPVNTPDVQALSFTINNGVKIFQLTAEPVKRKIAPWKTIDCWGFNGSCPGPTIQVNQGDRVRLILENLQRMLYENGTDYIRALEHAWTSSVSLRGFLLDGSLGDSTLTRDSFTSEIESNRPTAPKAGQFVLPSNFAPQ